MKKAIFKLGSFMATLIRDPLYCVHRVVAGMGYYSTPSYSFRNDGSIEKCKIAVLPLYKVNAKYRIEGGNHKEKLNPVGSIVFQSSRSKWKILAITTRYRDERLLGVTEETENALLDEFLYVHQLCIQDAENRKASTPKPQPKSKGKTSKSSKAKPRKKDEATSSSKEEDVPTEKTEQEDNSSVAPRRAKKKEKTVINGLSNLPASVGGQ